jgi:hypothetical protein
VTASVGVVTEINVPAPVWKRNSVARHEAPEYTASSPPFTESGSYNFLLTVIVHHEQKIHNLRHKFEPHGKIRIQYCSFDKLIKHHVVKTFVGVQVWLHHS